MHYRVRLYPADPAKRHHHAKFESWGGMVVAATPVFHWAVGHPVEMVIAWCDNRGMTWRVAERPPLNAVNSKETK